jgi:hypothetical protein
MGSICGVKMVGISATSIPLQSKGGGVPPLELKLRCVEIHLLRLVGI